jgi:hypothetical protein
MSPTNHAQLPWGGDVLVQFAVRRPVARTAGAAPGCVVLVTVNDMFVLSMSQVC